MNVFNLMRIINRKLPPYIWAWIAKYKNHEEQAGSGTLVFENTYGQKFSKFDVFGNTLQDGTPTPENPIPINNVTGENKIKVENVNLLNMLDVKNNILNNEGDIRQGYAIKLTKAGTYYLKFKTVSRTYFFGKSNNLSENSLYLGYATESTVPLTYSANIREGQYLTIWCYANRSPNTSDEIMISSQDIDYIPHEEQTVTFPLSEGQYMAKGDYLADDGIHHVMPQIVYDGSNDEIWTIVGSYNRFQIILPGFISPLSGKVANILCNKLRAVSKNALAFENYVISGSDENINRIMIRIDDTINSINELRAYLQENPITVQYELEEETIEPYTQAQQEAYDKIKELHTYLDYTQISQTNDGLSFILKVSVN